MATKLSEAVTGAQESMRTRQSARADSGHDPPNLKAVGRIFRNTSGGVQ